MNDIVICTESTTMSDGHYTGMGIVPGDGVQTVYRELLGHNRGKYYLYTGKAIPAKQLLDWGVVSEVVPDEKLLDRAWEIAREVFMVRSRATRRMTLRSVCAALAGAPNARTPDRDGYGVLGDARILAARGRKRI